MEAHENLKSLNLGKLVKVTKVGKDGQTTVPTEIRRRFDIKEGDLLEWRIKGNLIIVRKAH